MVKHHYKKNHQMDHNGQHIKNHYMRIIVEPNK
jgi:hypothetical protein